MTQTTARVEVTVLVTLDQPWGGRESADGVFFRATEEAVKRISLLIADQTNMCLHGVPRVTTVTSRRGKA